MLPPEAILSVSSNDPLSPTRKALISLLPALTTTSVLRLSSSARAPWLPRPCTGAGAAGSERSGRVERTVRSTGEHEHRVPRRGVRNREDLSNRLRRAIQVGRVGRDGRHSGLVLSMLQADSTTAQSTLRLGAMRILMTSFEAVSVADRGSRERRPLRLATRAPRWRASRLRTTSRYDTETSPLRAEVRSPCLARS